MNPAAEVTLVEERQALRRRLLEQRELLARRLGPAAGVHSTFPRSLTARFLIRRPDLAVRLIVRMARLLKSR